LIYNNYFNTLIHILNKKKNIHYGGNIINVPNHYSQYYKIHNELPKNLFLEECRYCNGRFYLLSNIAIEDLLKKEDKIKNKIIEDHTIGYYLNEEFKINILNINTNKIFKDICF
jgi:hypothetical protein